MSGYDRFKGLSEIDEELIIEPKKYVPLRLNFLLCIIAANISGFIPKSKPIFSLAVDVLSFAVMYLIATWFLNRKGKKQVLGEEK